MSDQAENQTDKKQILPLVISAPFGNYQQFEGTTATLGTFTAARRGGVINRLWRMLLTIRYYPRMKAWVNKIGLRNPGIDWMVDEVNKGKIDVSDKLVSIHGFCDEDWYALIDKVATVKPLGVELNMSCPNVGHIGWPEDLFARCATQLEAEGITVVVKIPPINYEGMVDQAREHGLSYFHCCNTLPNPGGGMSGTPLKGVSLQCIQQLQKRDDFDQMVIIGGGGIYQPSDVEDYAALGVKHVAIATKLMHARYSLGICKVMFLGGSWKFCDKAIRTVREKAQEKLG